MSDGEWRYDLDEVGEDADPEDGVEAGTPSLENALFVTLGAVTMVGITLLVMLG